MKNLNLTSGKSMLNQPHARDLLLKQAEFFCKRRDLASSDLWWCLHLNDERPYLFPILPFFIPYISFHITLQRIASQQLLLEKLWMLKRYENFFSFDANFRVLTDLRQKYQSRPAVCIQSIWVYDMYHIYSTQQITFPPRWQLWLHMNLRKNHSLYDPQPSQKRFPGFLSHYTLHLRCIHCRL